MKRKLTRAIIQEHRRPGFTAGLRESLEQRYPKPRYFVRVYEERSAGGWVNDYRFVVYEYIYRYKQFANKKRKRA